MQAAFVQARAYAESRRVFGKPLRDFPLTREKLAEMAAGVAACRQATYAAARLLDAGRGQADASRVKLLACHHAEHITRDAMQLHGGMGYAEEFAVSRLFADARVLSIFEGAEEVLALRVIVPALLQAHLE
jgi:(2S)-methylsuccinyl-CoA dehydrogenase